MQKKLVLATLFLFSMVCGVSTVLVHEAGHYLALVYFGYSPVLHYDSVSLNESVRTPLETTIINLAGDGITVVAALISLLLMFRSRHACFVSFGTSMTIRNIILLPYFLMGRIREEGRIGYLAFLIVDIAIIASLLKLANHRVRTLMLTLVGGLLGGILWIFWIGPILLP